MTIARFFYTLFFFCLSTISVLAQETAPDDSVLVISQFVLCEDVIEREPVNIRQAFYIDQGQAFCFARISNSGELITLKFKWYFEDEPYFEFDAKVGTSPHWRTYSSITLRTGLWRVELVHPDGTVLREIRFHCS